VGCALFFCCCFGSVLILGALADENSPTPISRITDPFIVGDAVSLGTVTVPADATPTESQAYEWPYNWKKYGVTYGVDDTVRQTVDGDLKALATSMKYKSGANGNFRWTPPPECDDEPWQCVYHQEAVDNREYVAGIAQAFQNYQTQQNLDARTTIELVISWVQHITYKLPDNEPFGLLPATRVAAEGWGDCDSKTMLAALVLDQLGVETVLLHSETFKHAALGVAVPAQGDSWMYNGDRYYFVEVTAPGWAIGTMPPDVATPRAWKVIGWK
jgi:hypothetical protein